MISNFPAPEESLSSFIIRQLNNNGNINIRQATNSLFGKGTCSWSFFPNMSQDATSVLENLLDRATTTEILERHTLLPLYRPVGSIHLTKELEQRTFYGSPQRKMKLERYLMLSDWDQTWSPIKYCPECFIEQTETHGFTWFKREWSIHGMATCRFHSCDLLELKCSFCCDKNVLRLLTSCSSGQCQLCSADLWETRFDKSTCAYANWLTNLLDQGITHINKVLRLKLVENARDIVSEDFSQKYLFMYQYSKNEPIGSFFSRVYDSDYTHRRTFRGHQASFSKIASFELGHSIKAPLDSLFFPLFFTFPNFDDFIVHLNKISTAYTDTLNSLVCLTHKDNSGDIFHSFHCEFDIPWNEIDFQNY